MKKFLYSLALLTMFVVNANAQSSPSVTFEDITDVGLGFKANVCGAPDTVTLKITNLSGGNTVTGITVDATLASGLRYVLGSVYSTSTPTGTTNTGQASESVSDLFAPKFAVTNIAPGQSVYIRFKIQADCAAIVTIQNPIVNTFQIHFGINGSGSFTNNDIAAQPYNNGIEITKIPLPNFSLGYGQNLNLSSGQTGCRQYRIRNTSITNGSINDFQLYDQHTPGLVLISLGISKTAGGPLTNVPLTNVGDTAFANINSAILQAAGYGDSLGQQNDMYVTECVRVNGCVGGTYNSVVGLRWGTCSGSYCEDVSNTAGVQISIGAPSIASGIDASSQFNKCFGSQNQTNVFYLTNNGAAPASNVIFNPTITGGSLTTIVNSGVQIDTGTGYFNYTPTFNASPDTALGNCVGGTAYSSLTGTLPNILYPGQTVKVKFLTKNCCPYICGRAVFNGWDINGTYTSTCNPTPVAFAAVGAYPTSVDLAATYTGTINFAPTTVYNLSYTVNSVEYVNWDSINGQWVVRVTVPASFFTFSNNVADFTWKSGSKSWVPVSASISGGVITARFNNSQPTGFNFKNSKINVKVTTLACLPAAGCSASVVDYIYFNTSYVPDRTCASPCEIPVECFRNKIRYQKYCGVAGNCCCPLHDFTFNRTTFGLPDNNDDGLPNGASFIPDSIYADRGMYLDTFQANYLISQCAGATFNNLFANIEIDNANVLSYIGGTISIRDSSAHITYNCQLPAPTQSGNFYSWKINAATISACAPALGGGYTFDSLDVITLNPKWRVSTNVGSFNERVGNATPGVVFSNAASVLSGDYTDCGLFDKFRVIGYDINVAAAGYVYFNACGDTTTIRNNFSFRIFQGSAGENPFPYEYRDWTHLTTLNITIPKGYAYDPNTASITINRTAGDDNIVTQTANLTLLSKTPNGSNDTVYIFNVDPTFTGTGGLFPYSDDGFDGYLDVKVHALNCTTSNQYTYFPTFITFGESANQHLIKNVAPYTGDRGIPNYLYHYAPNISLIPAVNPILGTGKFVQWQIQFSNQGGTVSPNSWLTFSVADTTQIKFTSLVDITGAPITLTPTPGGLYQIGNIPAYTNRTYLVNGYYTSCTQQTISVSGGWNCDPYGYPATPSAYAPCQTVNTTLYVNPVPAKIQTNIITQPATRIDLCDTITYAVQMGSVDYGRTFSNFVDVFLPLFGIKMIPGSCRLAYPDTNLYVTIPDPSISGISPLGKRYIFNTSLYNSYLDSFGLASGFVPDSASLFVQFKVVTDCGFFSGGRVLMRARAKDLCGNNIQPSLNSTRKLLVKTIGAPPLQSFDVRVTPGNIIPCDSATTVTQTIFNTGPYPSDSFTKIIVYLDNGISYAPGSAIGLNPPIMDTVGGIVRLTFTVPPGITVFDSLKVSYRVYAVDSGFNYSFTFRTEVVNDIKAICKTTGDTCDLSEITGEFVDTLTVGSPDIKLSNLHTYATCNNPFGEVVHVDYDLTNYSKPTRSDVNIYANLWWDANNNSQLDMSIDQKIATYVITNPIDSGQTVHVTGTYAVQAFQACGLIIQVDSITSACLPVRIDTALKTIPLLNAGDDVAGCFGDSVSLGCPGSISGYTYNWSAVGAAPIGALSCTNCSNPKYYFPVNNTPTPIVYQYVVSTDRGNCTTNDTVNITVNASPTNVVINSLDTNICFGQSTNLTAVGTPAGGTYQWSPLTFITPATGNTAIVTVGPPLTQTYTVKYTNVGCASYASIKVNVVPQVVVSAGVDKSVCVPSAPVKIGGVPTAAGGSGSFSYTWSPTTGLDNPSAANPNATVTTSTTYYVTVTDLVSGCFGIDSMDLTVNSSPSIDAGPNVSICPNSSSQLGASGGISYVWTPTTGLSNPNFCCPIANPSVATWYYVTGTDINGCKAVDSVLVTPIPSFSVTVPDAQLCDGDSAILTPSLLGGQYTYNWTPGTGLSCISCAQPSVSTNVNTIYVLTVTDTTTGCSANDTIVVTVRDKPKADFFGEQKCHGDTVQFTDHSQSTDPISTWSWDFGDSTYVGDGSSLQNPTYVYNSYSAHDASITVTTIYGCKDSFHLPVYSLPPVYPNAGLDTFVGYGSCVVLGGTGGTIFQWSPDSSLSNSNTANPTACPTVTTTYTVNITNDFGCSGTDSVTIEVKPLPNVNAGPDTAICLGTSYTMQGSSSTPNVTYNWIPVTFLSNPNIANPVATPTSTMTYVLKVTDQFGIVNYDTMTLTVNSLPVADAGTDKTLFDCAQDSVKLGGTPTANGGSGTYTYSWSPATGVTNTTAANPYVKGINASAQYCVTVTDIKGCTATDCINVSVVPSNLSVSIAQTNPTNWCAGSNGSAQFTANVTGGTGSYTYAWSPNSNINAINTQVVTVNPSTAGTYTYTVTVTDAKGCSSVSSASVTVNPLPTSTYTVTGGGEYCAGSGGVLVGLSNSQVGVNYQLLLNNSNLGAPIAGTGSAISFGNQTAAGSYTVVATNASTGCVSTMTGSVTVVVNSLPIADAGTDKTLFDCAQDSVKLGGTPTATGGSGTYTYNWSPATGVTNTSDANPYVKGINASAQYCVTVTDVKGCTASDCVNVTVVPSNLSVSIAQTNPTSWCAGSNGSAQFTANVTGGTGPYTYAWSPNSNINAINTQVVTVNPSTAGTYTYTVTVTDAKGCSSVSSASVTVNPLPTSTYTVTGGGAYCAGSGGVLVGLSNSQVGVNYQLLLNNSNLGAPIAGTGSAISFGNQTAAGSYTVVATNASTGCVSTMTGSVTVVINPLPIADAGADKTIVACAMDSIQIGGSPTAKNGTPGYTYSWSPPVGLAITNTANPWVKNISSPTLYTVTVTDINGCTSTDDVQVNVTGNVTSVTISNNGTKTWCEGGSGSVQFTANVTGGVGLYSYSWTPTTFIAPTNGQVVTVNPSAPGTYVYTVVVSDGNGCQASAKDSVIVKALPHPVITGLNTEYCASIVSVPLTASIPGGTFSGPGVVGNTFRPKQIGVGIYNIVYTVTVNGCTHDTFQQVVVNPLPVVTISGNDPDYCSLDYPVTFIGSPAGGNWSGIGINPTTGEFTPGSVTIPNNISRTVKVTYHYSDTNGCTDSTSVNVTVKKSPTLSIAVSADTICVGDAVTLTPSFSAIPQPVNLLWYDVNGTFITNSLNPIVVHPTRVDHAYYATVVNLQNCTVNDTVTIHVNQRPVAFDDTASTCEGFSVSVNVRANDTDPEGNTNNVKVLSVQHGTATVVANNVVYKSNFGYFGMDTFVYQICNTQCPNECDTAQGVVNVCPQNEPPVANPIVTTTPRNTPVPVNVGSATSDPNSDPLKYSYPGTPVNGGTVTVTGNGTVIYTPAPGFIGRDSFPYIVCDLSIYPVNVLCDTSYVVVNVTDPADTLVNHAPIANDDLTSTSTTNTVDVNVRANDVDPDGDALTLPQIIGNPTKGTASVNPDGTIKYVPNPSAFPLGISYDTIKYKICDTLAAHNPKPLCDDALVIITVNNVDTTPRNRPPFAGDDYESTPEDQPVVIAVKGNDSDPDGDALTLPQISVQPKNGTVTVNPNGTITYTPTPDYHGVDTFTYIVCDTLAALNPKPLCDTAKVYLVIDPRNEAPIANDIHTTTTEGTPVGVNVSASTTDPNGDPLTFTYPSGTNTGVPGATWTPTGNGTGVYTPAPGYVGTDSFQYVACDTSKYLIHVLCDTAWVYITVYDTAGFDTINHKPIANNDNAVTTPTQSIDIPVKANDNDPDGNPLTVSIGGGVVAGHGTVTPNADGTINYVPNGPFPVGITVDSFSYVVCDITTIAPQPLCDTAIVYVYINRIDTPEVKKNDPPVATDDYVTTTEDHCVTINVKANDSDPNGDIITTCSSVVSAPKEGSANVLVNGTIEYCPTPDFHGQDTFTYCICDDGNPVLCDTAKVIITIDPRNDAPIANDIHTTTTEGTPVGVNVSASSTDPNGDSLTFTYPSGTNTGVPGATWTPTGNGTGVYTPAPGYVGTDSFQYVVCDTSKYIVHVLCDTAWVYITVYDTAGFDTINHKPIANDDNAVTTPTQSIDIAVKANDNDPDGDSLAITLPSTITSHGGTVSVNADGTIKYTPGGTFPLGITKDTFTYVVCDITTIAPQPLCDTAIVVVEVNRIDTPEVKKNDPPVATDDYVTTTEDNCVTINVKANDSDPNGDIITTCSSVVTNPKEGTASVNLNGTITYCPTADYHGQDTFTYCICDDGNPVLCDTAKVIITIDPRNEAPIANDIHTTTTEGTPVGVNVSASTTDPNGDPLTFTYPSGTNTGVPGATWTPTGNGTGVYTPAPGYVGTDSFQYVACDTSKYLIHVLCDTAWVYITVYDTAGFDTINHKPIANNDNAVTTPTQSIDIPVKANDNDPDGNPLTVSIGGGVVAGHGTVTPNADGTINYVPNGPFPVGITVDSFSYVVCDITTIAPQPLCDTAIVYVYINRIDTPEVKKNDPPVATDDYVTTTEDHCVTINVKANDSDPNGDIITTCSSVVSAPKEGSANVLVNGTIEYCPTPDFHGQDTFTYCICDDGNPVLCDTAKVIITIDPRNDAPIANDIHTTTTEGTPVGVNVSASSTDPNGDSLTFTYPSGTNTGVPGATWTPTGNGTGVYTPAPGYVGTDSFQYVVCDTSKYIVHVLCDTAWVYITVYDTAGFDTINHKPIANDDNAVTTPTQSIDIAVKANDNDPDGDSLAITLPSTITSHGGTVSVNADGTIKYTPGGTFPLGITKDTFTYVVCDITTINPQPLCDTAIVVVEVNRIDTPEVKKNDPPVATDDYVTTTEDNCVTINVKANDSDPNGDIITTCSSVVTNPKEGTASVNLSGTITYCPTADYHGQDTFTYCICDDGNPVLCDTAKVIITIDPRNEAPIANDIHTTTTEGTPVGVNVSASTTDPNGDPLTFTYPSGTNTGVPGATWTPTGNGTGVYTPAPGYVGTDSFQYVACDTSKYLIHVLCDTAWVYITVYDTAGFDTINHKPIANNDNAVTTPTQSIDIPVKANDNDPDGNPLTVSIGGGVVAGHGTVTPNADGTINYVPNGPFPVGITVDSFSYVVCDITTIAPQPLCDTAIVYVYINRIDTPEVKKNDPPVATDDYVTLCEEAYTVTPVMDNDGDPNGDLFTIKSITVNPAHGLGSVSGRNIVYVPNTNYYGQDTLSYSICDNGNPVLCDTAKVIYTIYNINDAPIAINDSAVTGAEAPVNIPVLINDIEPDGDSVTVGISSPPVHGTLTQVGNTYTYTPDPGFVGYDTFYYKVCDIMNPNIQYCGGFQSICDVGRVSVHVIYVNRPPVIDPTYVTIPEDTGLVTICPMVSDSDGNNIKITSFICGPSHGTASYVATGSDSCLTYKPDSNYYGVDTICVVVCDDGILPLCDTNKVYITVVPVCDAPIAVNDYYTVTSIIPSTSNIVVVVNDTSVENSGLTVGIVTQPSTGIVSANANNTITYIPNGANGMDSFQYSICNVGPLCTLCDTAWVILNVRPSNNPPIAVNDTASTPEDSSVCVSVMNNDSDPDSDPIALQNVIPCGPSHGSAVVSAGQLCYTPNHNFIGKDSICYVICDNGVPALCDTGVLVVTVTPRPDPPIAVNDTVTTTEGTPICIAVMTNDTTPDGLPITITAIPCAPATGTAVNGGNLVCYTPSATYTSLDSFCYVICDNRIPALCDTAKVYVIITPNHNHPPVAVNDTTTTPERTPVVICVPTNDLDPDFNLNLASVGVAIQPAHGTITGVNPSTGCITYLPDSGFRGLDTFVYTICDTGAPVYCDQATVFVTVTFVNHPPVALDSTVTTPEDSAITVCPSFSDPDGDAVSITANPCGPSHGTVSNTGTCITYTPAPNYSGTDSICYVVCDNGSPSLCDTAVIRIIVTPVVDCPIANIDYAQGTNGVAVVINELTNDTYLHAFGAGSTVTIVSGPASGNTAVVNANGTISYTAGASYNGIDSVVYSLCDTVEGCCDTATIYVYTIDYCVPPIALDDKDTVCEEAVLKSFVRANDFQGFGQIGNVTILTNATHGFAFVNSADSTIMYTPQTNFFGNDTVTYQVCSQCVVGAGPLCDTAQLFITVLNRNDVPVAIDDTASVLEDSSVVINVVTNDYDIDGDSLIVSISAQPAYGTLTVVGNQLKYTPNANYCGPDSFGYRITGGNGASTCPGDEAFDLGLVFVNVICVNDPPVIPDTLVHTPEDTAVTVCVPYTDNDPNDLHTLSICGLPLHGTANPVLDNVANTVCLTYVPDTNYYGTDTICVIVCDNGTPQLCDTSHIVIVVDPRNEPPVANDQNVQTPKNTPIGINVASSASDPNGDYLTFTYPAGTGPNHGTWVPTGNGTGVYTPDSGYVGKDTFMYVACDTSIYPYSPLCDTAFIYIDVIDTNGSVNHPPLANDDYYTTHEGVPVLTLPLANDYDVDGDPLTITVTGGPNNGTIVQNPNGTITYTPDSGFVGNDTVHYTICDNGTPPLCDSAIIVITITPDTTALPNNPPVATDDFSNTNYGTPVVIGVMGNDFDPDGDSIYVTSVIDSTNFGTVTINPDGTVTYVPFVGPGLGPNAHKPDTFVYVICDNGNPSLCDTATVIITVPNSVQATNDTSLIGVNSTVVINVKANDWDPELDSFYVVEVLGNGGNGTSNVPTLYGNATINPDGTITYVPNGSQCDVMDTFRYTVRDTLGAVDTATVFVFVDCCSKPIAVDDNVTMNQGDTLTAQVLGNDVYKATYPQHVVISVAPVHGTATVINDTTVVYIPFANYCGTDYLEYILSDTCGIDTANLNITVECKCLAPVAVNDFGYTTQNTLVYVDVVKNDTMFNTTNPHAVTVVFGPNHGTATAAGDSVAYTPTAGYYGNDTLTYNLCIVCKGDTFCSSAVVIIKVDSVCQAPIAVADTIESGSVCAAPAKAILINDSNTLGAVVTIVQGPAYGTITLSASGDSITYTPDGVHSNVIDVILYSITNVCGKSDTGAVYVKVSNYPCNFHHPVALNDTAKLCLSTGTTLTVDVLANDFDQDNDSIRISFVSSPSHGTATVVAGKVVYTYTTPGFVGKDTFAYSVCDNGTPNLCRDATVIITIDSCNNNHPVIVPPITRDTTPENTPVVICVTATDPDADSTYITSICTPAHGTISDINGMCFTYTPDSNWIGDDTFCIVICDNGVPTACDTGLVIVHVYPIDTTQFVLANNDVAHTPGNTPVVINVLANDTFGPFPGNVFTGDSIFVSSIDKPTHGTAVKDTNGTIIYTPDNGYCGVDSFHYVLSDNGKPAQYDTATVIIYVCDTPSIIAVNDTITTDKNTPVVVQVLGNDTIPANNGVTVNVNTYPTQGGTVTVNADGSITYVPKQDYFGKDTFSYIVCANIGNGTTICDTATVIVNIPGHATCFFPNAFSPNGDGIDETFQLPCNAEYPNSVLKVYNRWGDEVWRNEIAGYKNDWDGKNLSKTDLPDGTYYYVYQYNDGSGKAEAKFVVIQR